AARFLGHVLRTALGDTTTLPSRRGLARAVVLSLLRWGERSGAKTACLQVVPGNEPAEVPYRALGFAEGYRCWCRVKERA
ncbi:MAG: hypothetical protein JRN54_06660, partial [Nitrososphaerota archaeon]|nr:hypothetical protein [Nitrososphaerota archaeon]